MKANELKEGETYLVKIIKETILNIKTNEDPNVCWDDIYFVGNQVEAEVIEIDKKDNTATLWFDGEVKTFAENVPLDSFEAIAIKVVTWKDI